MQHPHSHRLLAIPTDMCIVIRRVVLAAWLVSISGCANSQPVGLPSPSERSEPHEALAFYEGTWTRLDGKPEEDFRETCSWLPGGRRHMVCRARWQTANGPRETLARPRSGRLPFMGA